MDFYSLPEEIIRLIYSFDRTYTEYFSNQIVPTIPYYCVLKKNHLLFRAKEMVDNWLEEYPELTIEWFIKSYDKSSIKLVIRELSINLASRFYVSFVNHKTKLGRFVTLYMLEDNKYIYREEMFQTEIIIITITV